MFSMSSYSWKSVCFRLLALCVVMGVGFVAIGCDGKPQGTKCYSDRDCPANFRCEFSTPTGNADVAAPSQDRAAPYCDPNLDADALPAYCKGTTPPTGQSGQCVAAPQPKGCYSDRDCGSNQYCKSDANMTPPSCGSSDGATKCIVAAPYKGYCADKPTTKSCSADSDCGSDEYCKYDGTPTPTTRCGGTKTGSSDPDDTAGFRAPTQCDAAPPATGTCTKRPATKSCKSSSDCGRDEYCQMATTPSCGGTTDPAPAPGTSEKRAAMPPEPGCEAPVTTGVCVKRPVPPPPPVRTCENDRGCGAGEFCDFSTTTNSTDPDAEPGSDAAPADPPTGFRPMPEPPTRQGICRIKPKVTFCRHDGDCKNGYRCGAGNQRLNLLCRRNGAKSRACVSWRPTHQGICLPVPAKRCLADSDCSKGQRCFKDTDGNGSSGVRAMPAPCDPGSNCDVPAPPPPTYGVCKDVSDEPSPNCTTTRRSDGTVCTSCNGTTTCSKATP